MRKLLLIVCIFFSFSAADDFLVTEFGGLDIPTGEPDAFIAAEFNDQLKPAEPNSVTSGRFYLRQKFEDPFDDLIQYELFEGRATPAKGELSKFNSKDIPYTHLIKAKVYLNQGAEYDEDLEKVYFDGNSLFVDGESQVYVKYQGKMVPLGASEEKVVFIELKSQPAGASVKVDGQNKGVTPLKFSVTTDKSILVELSKPGHYNVIRVIKPVVGRVVQDGALLPKKQELDNPVIALKNKLLDHQKNNNTTGIQELQGELEDIIIKYPDEAEKQIKIIMNNYPPNPGQKTGESAEQFTARENLWKKGRDAEEKQLKEKSENIMIELKKMRKDLEEAMSDVYFTLLYEGYPTADIKVGTYAAGGLTLSLLSDKEDLSFTYTQKVSPGSKQEFQKNLDAERLRAVAKYWNLPDDEGNFVAIHDVDWFLGTKKLDEVGDPTIKVATPTVRSEAAKAQGAAFDSKAKAMTGVQKNRWVNEDKSKTMNTLAKVPMGDIVSAPEPTPAPVAEPEPEPVVEAEPEPEYDYGDEEENYDYEDNYADENAAADDAIADVGERWEDTDEYATWAAIGLGAIALGSAVGWYLDNEGFKEADNAVKALDAQIAQINNDITAECANRYGTQPDLQPQCVEVLQDYARGTIVSDGVPSQGPLGYAETQQDINLTTRDSHQQWKNIWMILGGISLVGSVTLFTIDF